MGSFTFERLLRDHRDDMSCVTAFLLFRAGLDYDHRIRELSDGRFSEMGMQNKQMEGVAVWTMGTYEYE